MRFPNWLPSVVANYANHLLGQGGLDEESSNRLKRLCTDRGMENAWKSLRRNASDETVLCELLNFVLREPRFLPNWKVPALSHAKRRQSLLQIAKCGARMIAELERLGGGGHTPSAGLEELRSSMLRMGKLESISAKKVRDARLIVERAVSLYEFIGDWHEQDSAVEYLKRIVEAALLALEAPPSTGPRKLLAKNVGRTHYVREVDKFIQSKFGKSLPGAVAAIINTSLDLAEQQITEVLVRNIRPPVKKPSIRKITRKTLA